MGVRALAALAAAFIVVFGGAGVLSADAANPSFTAVVNSLSSLPAAGVLEGSTCTSSSQCVVVGQDIGFQPLSMAGDPASWGAAQLREVTLGGTLDQYGSGSNLGAVTCASSNACVAVGQDGNGMPLVLSGDPASWTASQAQEIPLGQPLGAFGALLSITCTSPTSCVAVGVDGFFQPLVLAGDPATWSAAQAQEITLAAGGALYSITCTSASSCVAVGYDQHEQPIVLSGDPSSWTSSQAHEIVLGPSLGFGGLLFGVSCASSSSCFAVGYDRNDQPLVMSGDPSTWSGAQAHEVTLGHAFGSSGELLSLACPSATSCVAVGSDGGGEPLVIAGDPSTSWTAAQAREIGLGDGFNSGGRLNSIACSSATSCLADGIDANSQPLVLSGDPSTWDAPQAQEFQLKGVQFGVQTYPGSLTCVSDSSCLELGESYTFIGQNPYILNGNPASWDQLVATPMTGISPNSVLPGNACPTPTYCVAVGGDGVTQEPLLLTGDPSTWGSAQGEVISLGNSTPGGYFSAVTCTSQTFCVAVGRDYNGQPIVLSGDPATWSGATPTEITLPQKLHSEGSLLSVACTSQTACVAVGYDGYHQQPLVLAGDPATWNSASAKQIAVRARLGYQGQLSSVACPASGYCVAVGLSGISTIKPLVIAGDPTKWTAQSEYNLGVAGKKSFSVDGLNGYSGPPGKSTGYMISISCDNASYCVAVGGDKRSAPIYITGNPFKWKKNGKLMRPEKNAPSFLSALLTTSACSATSCFAGGVSNGGDFVASITG